MKRMIATATVASLFAATAYANAPSFSSVDIDGNNQVSWDELSTALPQVSLFDFSAVDVNGDGAISQDEMSNGIKYLDLEADYGNTDAEPVDVVATSNTRVPAFKIIDTNDDASVSWRELSVAIPQASLYDYREMDQNGDGSISEMEMAGGVKYLDQDPGDASVVDDGTPVETSDDPAPKDG